jgi:hypothetical protein
VALGCSACWAAASPEQRRATPPLAQPSSGAAEIEIKDDDISHRKIVRTSREMRRSRRHRLTRSGELKLTKPVDAKANQANVISVDS